MAGIAGTVQRIQIFTTELNSPDNKKIIVPNGQIISGTIVNYSANSTRRIDLVFAVSYSDDLARAQELLRQIMAADPRVLAEPAPLVAVHTLADSSVNLIARPWVASGDYWPTHYALTEAVKNAFDDAGITIPFPQRVVRRVDD
jgi:small conductance mechanosensitive channel